MLGEDGPLLSGRELRRPDDSEVAEAGPDAEPGSGLAPPSSVYGRRWYILFLFSLLAMLQSALWNFYSPINKIMYRVYGWDSYLVEWAANTAGLVYTFVVFPISFLVDARGARLAVVAGAVCCLLCAGIRLLPVARNQHSVLVIISMVFNGLAAAPIGLCPPGLSASWFPANERTLATAVATTSNYLGQAVGFFIGPAMVPNRANCSEAVGPRNACDAQDYGNLQRLYWVEAVAVAAATVLLAAYWPSKPPRPPTASAAMPRTNFCEGSRALLTHGRFWVVCLSFAFPTGWFSGWLASLGINLEGLGFEQVDEHVASMIGTLQIIAGCAAGIGASLLLDRVFKRRLKTMILLMYLGAFVSFSAFAVLCECWKAKILPFSMAALYITTILGGMCLNGTIPLFYELTMETVYPSPEGGAAGLLMLVQNALQSIFLAIPTSKLGSVMWMNWTLAGCIPLAMLAMVFVEARYPRADLDDTQQPCPRTNASARPRKQP